MSNILIIGALSDIAQAAARQWAARGDRLFLLARDQERLHLLAHDLQVRGAAFAESAVLDTCAYSSQQALLDNAFAALGGVDVVLIAHGSLPDQHQCEQDVEAALHEININALSVIALCTRIAPLLEKQQHGTLAVISSVAGDRGRQSNYVYGSAKAMVSIFLQGLRNRLYRQKVHVLTIKPGFVDTTMTRHLKKGLLWANAERVARDIVRAIDKHKNVVYTPGFWWFIMWVITHIPESIFKRLRL